MIRCSHCDAPVSRPGFCDECQATLNTAKNILHPACPFCNSTNFDYHEKGKIGRVCCDNCCAEGPYEDTEEEAWAAWDKRAGASPDLLAALRAAVGYMTNAVIDLQTGTKKQATIDTLSGGLKIAAAAIAAAEGSGR